MHKSPPLSVLAIVYLLMFVAAQLANSLMTSGAQNQNPYLPVEQLQTYYTQSTQGMLVSGFFLFASMMPLGLFTATVVSRLLFHRVQAAGVYIALFGGLAAAIFIGLSGLSVWALSQPGVATETGAMRVAQLLSFATGGFAHVAALGLLMAGVSVPCLFAKLLPRWVCWFGLILAAVCELAVLSILFPALSFLLPLGRFPGFIWLLAVGFKLPKNRRNISDSEAAAKH
ncbi:MAG: hypothetical protein ACRD4L_09990 [Pyrinomonadaceae bacterium]